MVVSPVGLKTKDDCADDRQQKVTPTIFFFPEILFLLVAYFTVLSLP
jgi:hypothetical protein